MSGAAIINARLVAGPSTYEVKGTGAFFGYGTSGIVLQNTDGSVVLWDVSGSAIVNAGLVAGPSTYQVKGTGDFFGDGHTDLRHAEHRRLGRTMGLERLRPLSTQVLWVIPAQHGTSRARVITSATVIPTSSCRTPTAQ